MNQCDGCKRGLLVENGIHRNPDGTPYMACTKSRYSIMEVDMAKAQILLCIEAGVPIPDHLVNIVKAYWGKNNG